MTIERRIRSALYPVTGPRQRRWLIAARDRGVGVAAQARSHIGERPLPSFVVGGVQKGGTTFLFHELLRHPDVCGPLTKEIHFFDARYDRGLDWYRGMFPRRREGHRSICGEASPVYVFHPDAIRRMAVAIPDVQLVIVLRDPVRRALSHYSHERRLGFEPCATFEEALDREEARVAVEYEQLRSGARTSSFAVAHFAYRRRGLYAEQLRRAAALLGRNQVHVIISEEMFASPRETVRSVLDAIGAGPWDVPPPNGNDMAFPSEPMEPATEAMLRDHFRGPNSDLEEFLGRPVPWH